MSLHEELERNRTTRVEIVHVSDGYLISRNVKNTPLKGDWISLGSDVYVVKQRIWNYSDGHTLKLIVEEPKD
jgi:hypothetical protein